MKRLTVFLFAALFFVILSGGCGGSSSNSAHENDAPPPKDRPLSDFAGDWVSGVPFIKSGELDEYIAYRASTAGMTDDEVKAQVLEVWKTDYENLTVSNGGVTIDNKAANYTYVKYHAVESEHGVSVWYIFKTDDARFPEYIMFNDHGDGNEEEHDDGHDHDHGVAHLHIKYGDGDLQSILTRPNWSPMYFDASASADEILETLLGH